MDTDLTDPSPAPKKLRFAPRQTRRRTRSTTAVPKTEIVDEDAEAMLLKHFNELGTRRRQRPKAENKSSEQATYSQGSNHSAIIRTSDVPQDEESMELDLKHLDDIVGQSTTIRASGVPRDGESMELDLKHLDDIDRQCINSSPMIAAPSVIKKNSTDDLALKTKEYKEPWNYSHTYYPTTIPWRMPYSGNPDILDEVEFGEAARKVEYDETKINSASELGLLNRDEISDDSLLFIQLPESVPAIKRSATAKGKQIEGSWPPSNQRGLMALSQNGSSSRAGTSLRGCSLEELSAGQMGKLLVYKSGAVKLKLGGTLFDVSPGSNCTHGQELLAVNTKKKECCAITDLNKRAVMTPDIEYLLNSVIDLN